MLWLICVHTDSRERKKKKTKAGRAEGSKMETVGRGRRVTHWSCRVSTLRRRWSSGRPHSRSPRGPSPHSASLSASGREEHMPTQQITLWFPFKEILTLMASKKEQGQRCVCNLYDDTGDTCLVLTDIMSTHHHFSFVCPHRCSKPLVRFKLQRLSGAVNLYHSVIWGETERARKWKRHKKENERDIS